MNEKLLLVGYGRSGKDCAAEFMDSHLGLPYAGSTSWAALPLMAEKLGQHPQMAWEQRHANRQFWKDSCDEFRKQDPLLLVIRALSTPSLPTYSVLDGRFLGDPVFGRVVTGIRDRVEIEAAIAQKIFQHIIWIERPGIPRDPTVTFDAGSCTDLIRNDGSLRRFHKSIIQWAISVGLNPPKFSPYAAEVFEDLDP